MSTSKSLDYKSWKDLLVLIEKGAHKTTVGRNDMMKLKLGMNRGRLLNSPLINITDKLKAIRSNMSKPYSTKVDTKKILFTMKNVCWYIILSIIIAISIVAYVFNFSVEDTTTLDNTNYEPYTNDSVKAISE